MPLVGSGLVSCLVQDIWKTAGSVPNFWPFEAPSRHSQLGSLVALFGPVGLTFSLPASLEGYERLVELVVVLVWSSGP